MKNISNNILNVVLIVIITWFIVNLMLSGHNKLPLESFRSRRKPKDDDYSKNVLNKSSKNVLDIGKKFNHLKERFNNLFS